MKALRLAGRNGRLLFVAGLVLGLALPGLAEALRPYLAVFVTASLFTVALRIPARTALGLRADLHRTLGLVLLFQLAMPMAAIAALALAGLSDTTLALAAVLMLAGSPIAGTPSITLFLGHDPAPALRQLVAGTALLPLTVLPVLWAVPALGSAAEVATAAARLAAVIAGAVAAAFLLQSRLVDPDRAESREALDGLTALILTGLIIGLMSALGPALRAEPGTVALWLAVAVTLNLGVQIGVKLLSDARGPRPDSPAAAVAAGNRNIALFIVALPEEVIAPALVFIGCYQIPMYLTPLLMRRFYAR